MSVMTFILINVYFSKNLHLNLHFSFHLALCNSVNIIARNWAISPNLDQKNQGCPFWLKIGMHAFLDVLIPNLDLDFWNFDPKVHFWAKMRWKSQSCPFCLKIDTHSISRILTLIPTLAFWIFNPKLVFGQI